MKIISLSLLMGGAVLSLVACSSGEKSVSSPISSPATEQGSPVASITYGASKAITNGAKPAMKEHGGQGGQVVETGKYHLELIPEKSAHETHLDLYVQKGDDHQTISNAKVSGEIQFPDGQSKPITFTYDAEGKHYVGVVPGKTVGAYQLKVTAKADGDVADGRFSFDR